MNRPHGKYIFLTTDLDEFIVKVTKFQNSGKSDDGTKAPEFDINDYKFIVTYSSYIPQRYSIQYDRAVDSAPTATYEASIIQLDDSRAIMGFDYIITGTTGETFAPMRLQLKDKEGTILAEHTNVNVPVKGNHYTIVEGRFLMQESSGGVAIDPGFNGPDIVVPI